MKILRHLPAAVFFLLLALAPAQAVSVKEDHDPAINFSKYKTFALKPGMPAPDDATQEMIERAVATQLVARGLVQTSQQPDLLVFPHVKVGLAKALDVSSFGYGASGWGGFEGESDATRVNVVDVPMGTLMLDMVDAASGKMVWRGFASGTLNPKSTAEEQDERIGKAVQKLLKTFPPAPKK